MTSTLSIGLATGDDDAIRDAAGVWARAAAQRDGTEADERRAAGGIRGRLRMRGGELLLAQRDADVVGFAVTVPQPDGLELFYLGVDPAAEGTGVARALLGAVEAMARAAHHERLLLWVIDNNARAVDLYERAGWQRVDATQVREDGRTEQRYAKTL